MSSTDIKTKSGFEDFGEMSSLIQNMNSRLSTFRWFININIRIRKEDLNSNDMLFTKKICAELVDTKKISADTLVNDKDYIFAIKNYTQDFINDMKSDCVKLAKARDVDISQFTDDDSYITFLEDQISNVEKQSLEIVDKIRETSVRLAKLGEI